MNSITASGDMSNNNSLSQFIKNRVSKFSWFIQLLNRVLIIFNFENERSHVTCVNGMVNKNKYTQINS